MLRTNRSRSGQPGFSGLWRSAWKYREMRISSSDNEPPGCPLPAAKIVFNMSRRNSRAMVSNSWTRPGTFHVCPLRPPPFLGLFPLAVLGNVKPPTLILMIGRTISRKSFYSKEAKSGAKIISPRSVGVQAIYWRLKNIVSIIGEVLLTDQPNNDLERLTKCSQAIPNFGKKEHPE